MRMLSSPEELIEKIQMGLAMPAKEFVRRTLSSIKKQSSPDPDFKTWSRIVVDFPENTGMTLLD